MKKTFKTKGGTDLPLLSLQGKDYLEVRYRIQWMREEHPLWRLQTAIHAVDDKSAVFTASISDEKANLIATGYSRETAVGFRDYVEKAETAAIGRALAHAGYGTQFAAELTEGKLADSPIQKDTDFNYGANVGFNPTTHEEEYVVPFGKKYRGKTLNEMGPDDVRSFAEFLQNASAKEGKPLSKQGSEFVEKAESYLRNNQDLRM